MLVQVKYFGEITAYKKIKNTYFTKNNFTESTCFNKNFKKTKSIIFHFLKFHSQVNKFTGETTFKNNRNIQKQTKKIAVKRKILFTVDQALFH